MLILTFSCTPSSENTGTTPTTVESIPLDDTDDSSSSDNQPHDPNTSMVSVTLRNTSAYAVNVYLGNSPYDSDPWQYVAAGQCHKSMVLDADSANTVIIEPLTECVSPDSYLLIENKTNSDIYIMKNGMFPLNPTGHSDRYIRKGGCGVYDIHDHGHE